jgi:hypothetical protein
MSGEATKWMSRRQVLGGGMAAAIGSALSQPDAAACPRA